MNVIQNYFDKLEGFFLRVSQLALLIMMLLTSLDALSRYFLGKSLTGAYEVTEYYLMVMLVFLSISYVQKVDGHIRLDVFYSKFNVQVKRIVDSLIFILGIFYFSFIGNEGLNMTMNAIQNNLVMSGLIKFPLWFAYIWVPIGSFLIVIRLIIGVFQNIQGEKIELTEEQSKSQDIE